MHQQARTARLIARASLSSRSAGSCCSSAAARSATALACRAASAAVSPPAGRASAAAAAAAEVEASFRFFARAARAAAAGALVGAAPWEAGPPGGIEAGCGAAGGSEAGWLAGAGSEAGPGGRDMVRLPEAKGPAGVSPGGSSGAAACMCSGTACGRDGTAGMPRCTGSDWACREAGWGAREAGGCREAGAGPSRGPGTACTCACCAASAAGPPIPLSCRPATSKMWESVMVGSGACMEQRRGGREELRQCMCASGRGELAAVQAGHAQSLPHTAYRARRVVGTLHRGVSGKRCRNLPAACHSCWPGARHTS